MKKIKVINLFCVLGLLLILGGCAASTLKAPCPDYGRYCQKIAVNHWNTNLYHE